ncbi:MAG: VRR-NUC domain-containing protein [Pseudomonadota bacterium]
MSEPIVLAANYYLNNFKKLTNHAEEWYADLLSSDEQDWLKRFNGLNHAAQCLLVRLLSRKGHWFRSDKLQYKEIPQLSAALEQLKQAEMVALNPTISIHLLAQQLLTKPELLTLFELNHKSRRKEQLIEQLPNTDFADFDRLPFDVIELLHPHVINLLLALFFANTHQDLSQFVLDELGLHQFERYQLSQARRFFADREQVDQLLQLSELQSLYLESDRKDAQSLYTLLGQMPADVEHPYVERKRQHLINDMARDLERLKCYEQSLYWFEQTRLPPSRERQARIYDALDELDSMSDVVTQMTTQPHDLAEQEVAAKLEQRLRRKLGIRVPRAQKPQVATQHLELDLTQQRVELAVKSHFESLGYQVYYLENLLLNGLFGLAYWQAIFAPVEGAFLNRYQYRPLDLYHADFCSKRQTLLQQIETDLARHGYAQLKQTYGEKQGINNPFIHWGLFDLDLLEQCEQHIPISDLLALFKVLLSDIKLFRSGMPDLILFQDGQYHWLEVKGPGDKVQDNQWRWFAQFKQLNIPFSVAYVNH